RRHHLRRAVVHQRHQGVRVHHRLHRQWRRTTSTGPHPHHRPVPGHHGRAQPAVRAGSRQRDGRGHGPAHQRVRRCRPSLDAAGIAGVLMTAALPTPLPTRSKSPLGAFLWALLKLGILLWCVFNVGMLLWVGLNSFRGGSRIFSQPLELPNSLDFGNYVNAWTVSNLGRGFINSILLVAVCTAITVVVAAMAAYVLARTRVP